jgi:hypothetical protein
MIKLPRIHNLQMAENVYVTDLNYRINPEDLTLLNDIFCA